MSAFFVFSRLVPRLSRLIFLMSCLLSEIFVSWHPKLCITLLLQIQSIQPKQVTTMTEQLPNSVCVGFIKMAENSAQCDSTEVFRAQRLLCLVTDLSFSEWDRLDRLKHTFLLIILKLLRFAFFKVFPKMLSQTNSIDLNTRHGNILGCAEVVHALYLWARQNERYDKLIFFTYQTFQLRF